MLVCRLTLSLSHTFTGRVYTAKKLLHFVGLFTFTHFVTLSHFFNLPGRIYNLKYEDFVEAPTETAKTMLDFVGLPWQANVMDFWKKKKDGNAIATASLKQVGSCVFAFVFSVLFFIFVLKQKDGNAVATASLKQVVGNEYLLVLGLFCVPLVCCWRQT
jgi:hypothetical protein